MCLLIKQKTASQNLIDRSESESHFNTRHQKSFWYAIPSLKGRYAEEAIDIIKDLSAKGKYDSLEPQLVRRLSTSQEHKTEQLLELEEMGDGTPSQFLRHLRALAGTKVTDTPTRFIAQFTNKIQRISGKENVVLDALSRIETVTSAVSYKELVGGQKNDDELKELLDSDIRNLRLRKVNWPEKKEEIYRDEPDKTVREHASLTI
ncbi:hypothetical protein KM043_018540 [Ampulex compressa]|nr:hypothetical protein KM043_018540 [Ampulex compressa]